jgi:hypothetical protein
MDLLNPIWRSLTFFSRIYRPNAFAFPFRLGPLTPAARRHQVNLGSGKWLSKLLSIMERMATSIKRTVLRVEMFAYHLPLAVSVALNFSLNTSN